MSERNSTAVERTGEPRFCLEKQHGKIWYPTAQIMEPRENDQRSEGKYNQMEIDQVEEMFRKMSLNLFTDCHQSPHPPVRSQLAKCAMASP